MLLSHRKKDAASRLAYAEKMLASLKDAPPIERPPPRPAPPPPPPLTPTHALLQQRLTELQGRLDAGSSVDAALAGTPDSKARSEQSRRASIQVQNVVSDLKDKLRELDDAHPPPTPEPAPEPEAYDDSAFQERANAILKATSEVASAARQLGDEIADQKRQDARANDQRKRIASVAAANARRSKFTLCLVLQAYAIGLVVAAVIFVSRDSQGMRLAA